MIDGFENANTTFAALAPVLNTFEKVEVQVEIVKCVCFMVSRSWLLEHANRANVLSNESQPSGASRTLTPGYCDDKRDGKG